MSVKIRISYETEEELAGIVRLLSPVMKSYRISRDQKGRYKRAYAELEPRAKPGRTEREQRAKPERTARNEEI